MDREAREARATETRARLTGIDDIPSLPPVLVQVWDLTSREDASAEDLTRAMSADPGLTGAVLRLANSAYFGFPRRVGTVKQAIVVLGFATVRSLATGASVFRALGSGDGGSIDAATFFRHSLVTAMGTRLLMERRWPQLAGSAFCAGILHDLGKLVIAEFLPSAQEMMRSNLNAGMTLEAAEVAALGMSHAEIGAWFAAKWNFPGELAAAVRWHHEPERAESHGDYAAAVNVADALAHRAGAGGGRPVAPEPATSAIDLLGLDPSSIDEWAEKVESLATEAVTNDLAFDTGKG